MNILNFALGGLSGGLSGSPLTAVTGLPIAMLLKAVPGGGQAASSVPARDSAISNLADISSVVNLLQQAAGSQTAGSALEPQLNVPPVPPMPTPKPAPAVPSDDHGQSNIVFSDADADGALIH